MDKFYLDNKDNIPIFVLMIGSKSNNTLLSNLHRVVALLLIPLVLICSSGATIFQEHCAMSKSPSYSLSNTQSCCCSKAFHDRCCHQNQIVIKKCSDQFSSAPASVAPTELFAFTAPAYYSALIVSPILPLNIYSNDHPPPEPSVPISILYRSLLI